MEAGHPPEGDPGVSTWEMLSLAGNQSNYNEGSVRVPSDTSYPSKKHGPQTHTQGKPLWRGRGEGMGCGLGAAKLGYSPR